MNNVPNINWWSESIHDLEEEILQITVLTIQETLRSEYQKLYLDKVLENNRVIDIQVLTKLLHKPELLTVASLNPNQGRDLVIYPDPPMGQEEAEVLYEIKPELRFATPSQLNLI